MGGLARQCVGGVAFATVAAVYALASVYAVRLLLPLVKAARLEVEMLQTLDAEAPSTHAEAYEVLRQFAINRSAFGLFLRSFETEASERVTEKDSPHLGPDRATWVRNRVMAGLPNVSGHAYHWDQQHSVTQVRGPTKLETWLAEEVAPTMSFVTLSNPAANRRRSALPRLDTSYDEWQRGVLLLVSAADIIVVEATSKSPGLLTELQILANRGREGDTLIVVPSQSSVDELDSSRSNGSLVDSGGGEPPLMAADDLVLAGFPHVLTDEEVLGLDDPAAFLRMLGADHNEALDPEAEGDTLVDWDDALLAARQLTDGAEAGTARDLLTRLVALAHDEGDRAREAEASFRLGLAYNRLEENDEALAWLRVGADLARESGDAELEGLATSNLASLLLRGGEEGEARTRLTRAVEVQRGLDSHYNLAWSLRHLVALVDDRERRIDLGRELVAVSEHLDDVSARFDARRLLLVDLVEHRHFDEAVGMLEPMAALVEATGDEDMRLTLPLLCVKVLTEAGRPEQARDAAAQGLVTARELGNGQVVSALEKVLAGPSVDGGRSAAPS